MTKSIAFIAGVLVTGLLCGGHAWAQETGESQNTAPSRAKLTPLKLQLVLSRYLGDKKVSSLPYLLSVTADDRTTTNLRMGVDVPVSTTVTSAGAPPVQSYNYRNVGTSIDCSATSVDAGYKVSLTLSDTSVQFDPKQGAPGGKTGMVDLPAFRTFTSRFSILLRDGQTAQYTTATDPVSGEVMKVDVTLNVMK